MTTLEWASFLLVLGFMGFCIASTVVCLRIVYGRNDIKRYVLVSGLFIAMFAGISVVGALSAPPFRWLSPEQSAIGRGLAVWIFFVTASVGAMGAMRRG